MSTGASYYKTGQASPPCVVEVLATAQRLPQDLLDLPTRHIDIQVIGGAIVHALAGLVPAVGNDVNVANYPFLSGFSSLPPMVGAGAAPGDTIMILKPDMNEFRFCRMDPAVPAFLYIVPRLNI